MHPSCRLAGALTAKPYAFLARPWELSSRFILDPLDPLATPLRLDLRGSVPLRLLPRPDSADPLGGWITDRVRFAYDGFRRQRLLTPLVRSSVGALVPITWSTVFSRLSTMLVGRAPALVVGPMTPPSALVAAWSLAGRLGLRSPAGFRLPVSGPLFSERLEQADLVLLLGCDLRLRLPLLHLRLRRLALTGVPLLSWGGTPGAGVSLGHRASALVRLVQGRHRASPLLAAARCPLVLLGEPLPSGLGSLPLAGLHSLPMTPAFQSLGLLGLPSCLVAPQSYLPGPLWLLGADGWDWLPSVCSIYQGHHGDRAAVRSQLVLPQRLPIEEVTPYRDLWGRFRPPVPAVPDPVLPAADDPLRALALILGQPLPPVSSLSLRLLGDCPSFASAASAVLRLEPGPVYPPPANPYRLDVISRASRPLALAARRLVPLAPNYPYLAMIFFLFYTLVKALALVVPLLLAVAFLTLAERKVLAAMQRRRGPNVVGPLGVLQPLADGVKMIFKETVLPGLANKVLFVVAPLLTLFLALAGWAVVPLAEGVVLSDLNLGLLYIFAVSSLGVYGIVLAGWSSNSRYAFLGALRSAAQMVSYEVSIGLILINLLLAVGSLNFSQLVLAQQRVWFVVPLFPLALLFFVSALAETNRPPFDLPEAEAELVSGYNVEYSAVGFVLFFVGEYANIILMSSLGVVFFLGGWLPLPLLGFLAGAPSFLTKLVLLLFGFIWVRAAFPRYRYDQLMRLGWKVFLPLSLGWVVFVASLLLGAGWFPPPS
jgi:NADH-quinone oxidoreductase subunit H